MKTSSSVGLMSAATIPMTRPYRSSSGPPEFPGLTAASIWMRPRRTGPPVSGWKVRLQAGDDASAHRGVQAERVADDERLAADPDAAGVAEGRRDERIGRRLRLDDRDVVLRLTGHDDPSRGRPVGEGQLDGGRVGHDVEAGQDVAGVVDDDAGPEAVAGLARAGRSLDLDQDDRWLDGRKRALREWRPRRLRGQRRGDRLVDVARRQWGRGGEEGREDQEGHECRHDARGEPADPPRGRSTAPTRVVGGPVGVVWFGWSVTSIPCSSPGLAAGVG